MFVRIFIYLIIVVYLMLHLAFLVQIKLALGTLGTTRTTQDRTVLLRVDSHLWKFKKYMREFNKTYSKEEIKLRFENFKVSLTEIAKLNAIQTNAVFGHTKFSDMSEKEFAERMHTTLRKTCINTKTETSSDSRDRSSEFTMLTDEIADKSRIDWREHNIIGPILNQRGCGGCWAFSIVGVMESMARLRNISYEDLSIQEVMDCYVGNDHGCAGRNVYEALLEFKYLNRSVMSAKKYPLNLRNESCQVNTNTQNGIRLKEFTHRCNMSDEDLQRAILHGPVIAIVNPAIWRYYLGGIIQRDCVRVYNSTDHAIQVVGFDKTGDIHYYIVRNSWGTDFGIEGYVKLEMGKNMCGIAEDVSTLEVK